MHAVMMQFDHAVLINCSTIILITNLSIIMH